MIRQLLASGELGKLASLVSPAFFEVMPARALWSEARTLLAGSRDVEAFRHSVAERAATLAGRQPIELSAIRSNRGPVEAGQAGLPARERGAQVVELYFHQLFTDGPTLLDLRPSAFSPRGAYLCWQPARWVKRWTAEFIEPLRLLYRGFYTDDAAQLDEGLRALSLSHSEDLFRTHFGGNQAEVRFRTKDFIDTFHQVFVRCENHRTRLHPDFLPLGIYLAALYEHLEQLDVAVDVAGAFERALRPAPGTDAAQPPTQTSPHVGGGREDYRTNP